MSVIRISPHMCQAKICRAGLDRRTRTVSYTLDFQPTEEKLQTPYTPEASLSPYREHRPVRIYSKALELRVESRPGWRSRSDHASPPTTSPTQYPASAGDTAKISPCPASARTLFMVGGSPTPC